MRITVDAHWSARGILTPLQKVELELDSSDNVETLKRLVHERFDQQAAFSENLRLIRAGALLTDESQLSNGLDHVIQAVFVERKNRTHVDSVKPFLGLTTGGAKVNITGVNFATTVRMVKFGSVLVEAVRYSSEILTCIAPPHAPGVVDVEVDAPGEGFTSDGLTYTYVDSIAEGAEMAIAACNEEGALEPLSLESCRPINSFVNKRDD